MQNFCLSEAILERFKAVEKDMGYSEHIVKLDCSKLDTWEFRDRKDFELGNIDDLALSIKHAGQCQPIVVVRPSEAFRPKDDLRAQYVVIAGYRRWMACKKYNMEVEAIVKSLSFEQAITVLVSENEKETVSDYSKGLFYHTLFHTEKMSKEELCRRLNVSMSSLNNYLSFAEIPDKIWAAIGDLSRVSAKTASVIYYYIQQGPAYVEAIISIAKNIAHGFGEKRIHDAMAHLVGNHSAKEDNLDHKIKFKGKVLMNSHEGHIRLGKSLVLHPCFEELVSKIEADIKEFAQAYLGQGNVG